MHYKYQLFKRNNMYLNEFYKIFFGSFENILLSQKTLINQTKSQIDSHTYKFC